MSACHGRLERIRAESAVVLADADMALRRGGAVEGEPRQFDELFDQIWRDLCDGLEVLLVDLRV